MTRLSPARLAWGWGVWSFVVIVFAIPEAWSGFGSNVPWPTLSITIAHLESLWPGTRVVIVGLIVLLVFRALRYPFGQPGDPARSRTANGRLTLRPDAISEISAIGYLIVAVAAIAGGSLLTANLTSDMYVLGDVLWGLFAIFLVLIPNTLAYWFGKDVAFPTFYALIGDLESRWRFAVVLVVFGLVILALHLVFFPWPNIPT